ncbi:PepSY domain-containing protein [Pseudomonas qingdaonensis]|uniref:PepSY domain-containing protein n=1 Tax=Pseudomonas qingdaonensis TaxID=2056231 RepID=A0ABX8DVS4_9PSED|nr:MULTISPECIES: PepSY-associated TM helix domain-containing protein [Pseudomonas]MDD1954316.1 PepSY domain-containing protein [Pseudomonas sp. 8209]QVL20343.1 PepSY domain-containing protein [Pseudomonas qingdaonensis]
MSTKPARAGTSAFTALLKRLHFYIGLLTGPFLLVTALSGVAYALTPQLENWLYADVLNSRSQGPAKPLDEQIQSARSAVGPHALITAVRPAPVVGDTTRVMFTDASHGPSESRAVFVDPVTAQALGELNVYGTSGVLPLRTAIDQFHRSLLLGDPGRLYSELAASWLWIAALGGLVLWLSNPAATGRRKSVRKLHRTVGLWLLLGLLFFSATGLTWSRYAGENIGVLRAKFGWSTPSVSTVLGTNSPPAISDEHAEHHHHAMDMNMPMPTVQATQFLDVLNSARAAGIDADKVEIKPARDAAAAWVVREIAPGWPTQVDAVSIDPRNLQVVDEAKFVDYPIAAKLTRWGIDAHMGLLFGPLNQLILVVTGLGLALMVVLGYLMWWRRRPVVARQPTLLAAWRELSLSARCALILFAILLGYTLPVLGGSLLLLLVLDLFLTQRAATARTANETP